MFWIQHQLQSGGWRIVRVEEGWDESDGYPDGTEDAPAVVFRTEPEAVAECRRRNYPAEDNPRCPRCEGLMEFVKEGPQEIGSSGSTILVQLDSSIYECPAHGLWRAYISGALKPYREQANE